MKTHTESRSVTWVFESNAEGQWALVVRVGATPTQLSPWFPTSEALVEYLVAQFGAYEPPEQP